ncbi:MAG: ferritin-like domain-containing protein [Steroidobacteraceae bacterium]
MKSKGMTRRALLGNIAMVGVATGPGMALARTHRFSPVQQDFSDPYLELIRLLKEAAEIEQDLMLQYLYAAYALKPAYAELVGSPTPNATSLMGVIIQEMQHLGDINRLLVELDAKPVLTRLDIPYETDVYPFPFELAPLSSVSLAKFTYVEADPVRLGHVRSITSDSVRLVDKLKTTLGGSIAANHVGKLYDAIVETLGDVKQAGNVRIDFGAWFQNIGDVKAEGEFGHFKFFHSLYEGAHPLVKETPGIWDLPATDARYPSYQVPVNPTAYEGRPNTIKDADLRALAWLGNLNYWCLLLLLDAGYRRKSKVEPALAQAIMLGPLMSIARYLPTKGSAVPFDPLSMGFDPGLNDASGKRITRRMLEETRNFARSIEKLLPGDFNLKIYDQLLAAV